MQHFTTKTVEGKLILFGTILASGMAFLDGSVVNIAIPTIQKQMQATLSGVEWAVNAYALVVASLILICGSLGDKFGRRKIFTLGIGVFALSSFLCSISNSINQLVFFRTLQGIGAAMMIPGSLSIINTSFEESIRGKVIGLWSGFAGGIAALGPFLGGFLVQTFGWPSIFYINIPLGILALFISLKFIPESKTESKGKIDILGSVLIFLSLLGIAFGLMQGPSQGFSNPSIVFSLAAGLTLFILFIFREKKASNPLIPFDIFKSPLVTGANLSTLCLYFALSGVIFFLVLNFQQLQNYPPLFAGMGLLPSILLITFLSGPGGVLADRIGPKIPMTIGSLIVCLGIIIIILSGKNSNYFFSFMPALILYGIGMSLVIAPLTKSALSASQEFSGMASGVNNAVARVAGLLAIAVLGAVIASGFSNNLNQKLAAANFDQSKKIQIQSQENKLLAIEIPDNFTQEEKAITKTLINDSFLSSFRVAMGINAMLALLSAIISAFLIKKQSKAT